MSTGMWRRGAASHEEPGTPKLVRPDPAEGFADEVAGHLLSPAGGGIGVVHPPCARGGPASPPPHPVLRGGPAPERPPRPPPPPPRPPDRPPPHPGFPDP